METREEFRARLHELMRQADLAIKETSEYLISQGHVLDLTEWVTINEYCRRFGIKSVKTVQDWIARGVVPADDTAVIEEYNNVQMLRATSYLENVAHNTK
ncbi:hypothetical protein [Dyadobacter sp. MSC1_007]|jgi:hypothetical protein|uniref:hypothetical protein n=1 Tax=Dyadobacter sp. MSC1_007 TaxID=2909264 RepID=UPI00202FA446|nr:hypothetical protein [Dyadobacter sp. MSC1_007]